MAVDETQEIFVIALEDDPKDFIAVSQYDIGRLLSSSQNLAEVSFPRQRCYMHLSKLLCLNGEGRGLANTFKRINNASKAFKEALKREPKCYLEMSSRLLRGIKEDLRNTCNKAAQEIDGCCSIVDEWLKEIEKNGQIHYLKGAQHFYNHIDNVKKILVQEIARRNRMRS
ncbi:MAG: hypothetical protein ACW991_09250 [Candidatus Hodarchaeales archaeon]|jgi:hypothetical protein